MTKTNVIRILVVMLGIYGLRSPALAQDSSTCAGWLLKNNASVRAEGMGEAQAGVNVNEAGALGFNPAGLYGMQSPEVSMLYYRGLVDESFGMLNFSLPMGDEWAVGAGVQYFDGGTFDWNTEDEESRQVSAERDGVAALTAAHKLNLFAQPLVLGVNLKCLKTTLLNEYSSLAGAADVGARCDLNHDLSLGLAVRNLGTPIKYLDTPDPLPRYAMAGFAYHTTASTPLSLLLAIDTQYDLEKQWSANAGVEVKLYGLLAVRAGYRQSPVLTGWTAGLGCTLENIGLDYSVSMPTGLTPVQRMGINYAFGGPKPAESEAAYPETPEAWKAEALNPRSDVEKIPAQITGIERVGGRIVKVSLNIGSKQRIKPGFHGTVVNAANRPIGGIIIRLVDSEASVAEVVGLGQDISLNSMVLVEKPIGQDDEEDALEEEDEAAAKEIPTADAPKTQAVPTPTIKAKPETKANPTIKPQAPSKVTTADVRTEMFVAAARVAAQKQTAKPVAIAPLTGNRAWQAISASTPYMFCKKIFDWLTRLGQAKQQEKSENKGGQHESKSNRTANKKV